jgi:MFS transporter, SP family, solute carrier family 2 (facilitated glucose transporter), member 3
MGTLPHARTEKAGVYCPPCYVLAADQWHQCRYIFVQRSATYIQLTWHVVIFYSTDILSRVVPPEAASYISLGIAVLNAIMTFPAIVLIQQLGRRTLLVWIQSPVPSPNIDTLLQLGSMSVVAVSLYCIAIGLNAGIVLLSSSAILVFVGSFAIGLGPVPYVLVGELVPFYVCSKAKRC